MSGRVVGFTGTQHGITAGQNVALYHLFRADPCIVEFHHGSCWGADVQAARLIRELLTFGVHIVAHPGPVGDDSGVDDVTRLEFPYLQRNHHIVNETGELIGAPQGFNEVTRSGTWATIRYARKIGRKITLVFPNGRVKVFGTDGTVTDIPAETLGAMIDRMK
jgi:hypothetical protein